MSYQHQGGEWSYPPRSSSQFGNSHGSGTRQQFENINSPHISIVSSGHQWTPPQHKSLPPNVDFSSIQNSYPINFSHPAVPDFKSLPPPGPPPPVQNTFSNPPSSFPPPPFHQSLSCGYEQPPTEGSHQASNVPSFHPVNFDRPPPPLVNTYAPYAQPPTPRNPTVYTQLPPPRMLVTTSALSDKIESQRSPGDKRVGGKRLETWLQLKKRFLKSESKPSQTKEKSSAKIWDFMNRMKKMEELIGNLSTQVVELTAVASTTDDAAWEVSKSSCDALKEKISTDFGCLLEDHNLQAVGRKFTRIREKRARMKKTRTVKFEHRQLLQHEWDEKSKDIDKWQERRKLKIQEENKEKRRKAAADRTLSKVTREIQDATRLIDTMLGLEKLRLIRRDAAQKRGDSDIGESRQSFEEKVKDMTRLVKAQLECYKDEEAKLKQVLKSEEEKKSKLECQFRENKARLEQEGEDAKLRLVLFGPEATPSQTDPLLPFSQYYKQASHSLSALLQIRQEWDRYVVPKGTPASSCIPSTWITPEPPSSSVWSTALQ